MLTVDEAMKYWRMADAKFSKSYQQAEDYVKLANRLVRLAKHAPAKLAAQWRKQAETYKHIAFAIQNMEGR